MCGIAGKLWFDAARPGDAATARAMGEALVHRGPDDAGWAVDGPLALAHRRLTVVDTTPRGRQPMASTDGRCLLVANGEIYNHLALREALGARGHAFASDCDVEVLLPLYLEHFEREGVAFLDRLEGMFAFALWDGDARRLLLARDRAGQKPLVYARGPHGLSFASEVHALGRDPDVDRDVDWGALGDYLAFRVVPHPATAWRGARKLPPGHAMIVEDGEVVAHRWARFAPGPEGAPLPDAEEAAGQVADRLEAAVAKRLMSDVPLGAFLSGGLDSAVIVAVMAALGGRPVRTFTIGFEEPAYDETADARRVARLLGTEHHEAVVRPDAVALVDRLLRHHGEPFADGSALPTFLLAGLAREHVKVVLTGDGGDEAYAGYERYRALALAERLSAPWMAPARGLLRGGAHLARWLGGAGHRAPGTRLQRLVAALDLPPRRRNHAWRVVLDEAARDALLTPQGRERFGRSGFYGPTDRGPLGINQATLIDVERYLPDDILVKLDVATMAHGLEARSPFLDHALLEHALSLPSRLKLQGRVGKAVLRRAARRWLPADVVGARKRGFGAPLDRWFRGPLAAHAREVLLDPRTRRRGLLDVDAVGALLDAHVAGRTAAHEVLFSLLVLERWLASEDVALARAA